MNETVLILKINPGDDYEEPVHCRKCWWRPEMTKTNGHRNHEDLWFCEDCGAVRWVIDEETYQQQEWERYWLKRVYGVEHPVSIRDYWTQPQKQLTGKQS